MFDQNQKYIYCAAAIKGDTSYRNNFEKIVKIVEKYFDPATEIAESLETLEDLNILNEKLVYERDIKWLRKSKALIAEMSGASSGVGSEVTIASRELYIPCLLLYNINANSSLYIRQMRSIYLIHQDYNNINELEIFVRCFLNVINFAIKNKINDMLVIKKLYESCEKKFKQIKKYDDEKIDNNIIKFLNDIYEDIEIRYTRLSKQLKLNTGIKDNIHIIKSKYNKEIDFKDSKQLIDFFLKTIILHIRWKDFTKRQELGWTFFSGTKDKIIKVIPKFEGSISFGKIYERLHEEINYSKEAFTKNLRAYRKIGLIENPYKVNFNGSSKFKNSIIVQTLSGEYKIISSNIKGESLDGYIILPAYIYHLNKFIKEFGREPLYRIIKDINLETNKEEIFNFNINEDIDLLLDNNNIRNVVNQLKIRCEVFWKQEFSSFK